MKILFALIALVQIQISFGQSDSIASNHDFFNEMLDTLEVKFFPPDSLELMAPIDSWRLECERGYFNSKDSVCVQFTLRETDMPELMMEAFLRLIAESGTNKIFDLDTDAARELCNANRMLGVYFTPHPSYTSEYSEGLLVAIHKNEKGSAFVLILAPSKQSIWQHLQLTTESFIFLE